MADRLLYVRLNHAQRRVTRPRLGISARGSDFADDQRLTVCPATGAVRLRANFERDEYETSDAGAFEKLKIADFTLYDLNSSALPDPWLPLELSGGGLKFVAYQDENLLGVGGITSQLGGYEADRGFAVSVFAYSTGAEQDGEWLTGGWNDTAVGTSGLAFRIYYSGKIEIYKEDVLKGTGTLTGSAGYGRASVEYVMFTFERGRGRDLVVRSSKGGAFVMQCDWVDPDDPESVMIPDGKQFWWKILRGPATAMICPITYETTNYSVTRTYTLAEPPDTGETLEDFAGSDRFTQDDVHIIGHPQGGSADFVLRNVADSADFTPDGALQDLRIKLTLTSNAGGVLSPWVWGIHTAYANVVEETPDESVDITELIQGPVRLSLQDSYEGLSADFQIGDIDALEELAPFASMNEGTPILIQLEDPEEVDDPVILLDGQVGPPEIHDGLYSAVRKVSFHAMDRLIGARMEKVREAAPFDGMPMCQEVGGGFSAALLILRELGFADGEIELPDVEIAPGTLWRLPDVPGYGDSFTDEWNFAAVNGDMWLDLLERLFDRAPEIVWGCRPTAPGENKFVARFVSEDDAPIATVYRTVDAAMTAEPSLSYDEAARLLYDDADQKNLPLAGNAVLVTGYDRALRAPIQALKVWDDSADPTLPALSRFLGWIGQRRSVEFSDPALTTLADCEEVRDNIYDAVARTRAVVSFTSQLPFIDGIPIWRGEVVALDDFKESGEPEDLLVSAWVCDLIDESGRGYMAGAELAPSRPAQITAGAILGYGGATTTEIRRTAETRVASAKRYKGWQNIESISPFTIIHSMMGQDIDAKAWRTGSWANGGIVSHQTIRAITTAFESLKDAAIWTKMPVIVPLAGENLASSVVGYKPGTGSEVFTNTNFVEADYDPATGLTGNGSKYLSTSLIPNNAQWGASAWLETSLTAGTARSLVSAQSSSTTIHRLGYSATTPGATGVVGTNGANGAQAGTDPMPAGFYTVTRIASNDLKLYRNGVQIASNTTGITYAPATHTLAIFGNNNAGTVGAIVSARMTMAMTHHGLTPAEAAALHTIMATLRADLGRA